MPADRMPADRMPADRRQRLVRIAAAEFSAAGYDRASLNRIIQDCGLSKSSFYHFIASKEELFALVVADLAGALTSEVNVPSPDAFAGADFWPQVDGLFDRLMVTLQSDESYSALGRMFYLSGAPEGTGGAVGRAVASVESWVRRVLEAGRGTGAVRTDLPVELQAQLVFAALRALDEWAVRHLEETRAEEWPSLSAAQKGVIRRMLEPDASPRSG